jgi:hypothetical protein
LFLFSFFSPSSRATNTLIERLGRFTYFLPVNPILGAFCPIISFHNS